MLKKEIDAKKRNGLFYGWIVCGVCTLLIFITMGTASNGLAVFLPYIMKEHGLSNAQTSSLVTLRVAFMFTAAYVLAAAIIIFILIREKPQDKGLEPLGQTEMFEQYRVQKAEERKYPDDAPITMDSAQVILTRRGWLLMGAVCIIMGALSNPGFVHLTVLYTSEGFKPMTVAFLISICGIVLTIGKVICGEAADLLGGLNMSLLFSGILFAGNALCCLSFTGNVPLAAAAVFLYGLGSPVCTVGIPVWAGDLSSPEKYPMTVRNLQLTYAAGAMIFATMPGIIADHLGSYIPVYALFACLLLMTTFSL